MSESKSQVVFISSLKGGAGKTTLAISLCVTEAYIHKFDEIYFFDIDLFGSGSEFILDFNKKQYINDINNIEEITRYYEKKEFTYSDKKISFNCAVIDPIIRTKKTYFGDILAERTEISQLNGLLANNIVNIVKNYSKDNKKYLFIFDCSPGFDSFTQQLILEIKQSGMKTTVCFASTYDNSHILKLERFMESYVGTAKNMDYNFKIILVDSFNAIETVDDIKYLQTVEERILKRTTIKVIHKGYQKELSKSNLFLKRRKLENAIDMYFDPQLDEIIK